MKDKYLIFSVVSLLAIIYNMMTMSNVIPWIDEGMFTDISANLVLHGKWETTAWNEGRCIYMPLYQFLLAGWIKVFGFSLLSCRSLNLLLMYLLGLTSLKLMQKIGGKDKLSIFSVVIFGLLFWLFADLAWMYRNGRVDILGALWTFLLMLAVIDYVQDKTSQPYKIFGISILLVLSGIQAGVFVGALFLFFFALFPAVRKKIATSFLLFCGGASTSIILTAVFMYFCGNLKAYLSSFITFSATLRTFYTAIRPYLSSILGEPKTGSTDFAVEPTFLERLVDSFLSENFLILLVVTVILILINVKHLQRPLLRNKAFLMFVISLYIPLFMTIAGRFAIYYRWMCYLPMIYALTLLMNQYKNKLSQYVVTGGVCVLILIGIKSLGTPNDETYSKMAEFIHRQPFGKKDKIIATFPTFYEVKTMSDSCYFLEIYSIKDTPIADYIICPTEKGKMDEKVRYYLKAKSVEEYIERIKSDSTKMVTAIDELDNPSMIVYAIRDRLTNDN